MSQIPEDRLRAVVQKVLDTIKPRILALHAEGVTPQDAKTAIESEVRGIIEQEDREVMVELLTMQLSSFCFDEAIRSQIEAKILAALKKEFGDES